LNMRPKIWIFNYIYDTILFLSLWRWYFFTYLLTYPLKLIMQRTTYMSL